ncbi:MAG TPA: alpha-amylase [Candidatus Uhrbacteria bacterium]|nr:alpha-amylase [Candidatus Uhrbacteria bacterium]
MSLKTLKTKKELKWSANDIVYQIYPRSFKDTTGNGIGDLQGIIEKLDYLHKILKVDAIWLCPIYKSPMKDFGYDIADYCQIDPLFGNFKLFDNLVKKAHGRGLKILMDFVPNHTSDQHPWFIESRSALKNPKRDWYIWQKPKPDGSPPNNWLSRFGGSAWTFDPKTKQYYLHSFLPCQPDLNWRNPQVQKEMRKILEFWLVKGVDGFRLDALYHIIKDDKFRDNPINPRYIPGHDDPYRQFLNVYDRGRPATLEILNKFCGVIGQHKNKFLVSEVFYQTKVAELKTYYKLCQAGLHAPFNFNFIRLPWSAWAYRSFLDNYEENLSEGDCPNYVLGNHDRSRVASRLESRKKARLLAMLVFTLKGMPFIYYGEEIGMSNVPVKNNEQLDPWGKNVPGFGLGRDAYRTPMQWSAQKYAGFSKTKPWLPVARNYLFFNVKKELADKKSFLSLYRNLISFRKKSKAILEGNYYPLNIRSQNVFAYVRESETEKVLVLLNFASKTQKISLPFAMAELVCNTFLSRKKGQKINLNKLYLKAFEGYLFKLKK